MLEWVDEIAEPVYVADLHTYELLYANNALKDILHISSCQGLKCYKTFQGLDEPCPFCTADLLQKEKSYSWEHYNAIAGERYLLKDWLIDWEGRPARLEVAFQKTAPQSADNEQKAADFSEDHPLLREYNMLMSSMRVSVSKHLLKDNFQMIWANDYFYEMTGYTAEEFKMHYGDDISAYFKEEPQEFKRLQSIVLGEYKAGKSGYEAVIRIHQKSGTYIWINLVGTFTEERMGGYPVIYTVFTNVNDMIQAQKEQSITYDNLPGFIAKMLIHEEGPRLLYGSKQFDAFFGKTSAGESNKLLLSNMHHNWQVIEQYYPDMQKGKTVTFEIEAENTAGEYALFQIKAECVDWIHRVPVYLIIFLDITLVAGQRELLRKLAYVDPITDGRNRACFELDAGGAVKSSPACTYVLISLDIQKFKVINDLFGIEAGDKTLRYVYERLSANLDKDEYVARISSDLFNLLLKEAERPVLEKRILAILEDINSFNVTLEHKYLLMMTAGVYLIDEPLLPMTQLQDRANVAHKQVKGLSGSGLCEIRFYSNEDRLRLAREKDIENRMQDALQKGEFVVYLQPKQDLKNHVIAGAEALVRWNDPQKGLIPPDEFIPLFEKNGFIIDMDLYVFDTVCALLQKWIRQGLKPVPVSVNMSRAHLTNQEFLKGYEEIRKKYDIPAELLEIEVTETLIFENPQLFSDIIDSIHRRGYRCSMDDFGSGYSSLNVLKDIRVDTLKLDRAFFSSSHEGNSREADIIGVVVELAKKLHMTTVAEGVETEAQADFLSQAGCDLLQGFLFSRPVPVEEFEKLAFK